MKVHQGEKPVQTLKRGGEGKIKSRAVNLSGGHLDTLLHTLLPHKLSRHYLNTSFSTTFCHLVYTPTIGWILETTFPITQSSFVKSTGFTEVCLIKEWRCELLQLSTC